jgi:hypothetical protein
VHPGEAGNIFASKASLDEFYVHVPSGKFQVLVYDVNIIKTTPWDTVVSTYPVLKRYELMADNVARTVGGDIRDFIHPVLASPAYAFPAAKELFFVFISPVCTPGDAGG